MLETVLLGLSDVFNVLSLVYMFLGVTCGIVVGAIPGLSGPIAIALCIPLTYYMSPVAAIGFLVGINKGGTFGGSIASILLNTPGSPESSATCYDGYPLALQGKGEKALKCSLFSSFFGDTISALSLIILSIPLAAVALKLSPPDLCAIMVFSLVLVSGLDSASIGKSLIAASLGMLLSTVGMDCFGDERLTFNNLTLSAGIPLMSVAIGTMALSELVFQMQPQFLGMKTGAEASCGASKEDCTLTPREMKQVMPTAMRSSLIGVLVGVLPGLGSTMAAFMAYGTAKKASKHPEEFGKGSLEGVSAPEAANNAIIGANLVPLLTLGIPGNVSAAIIMGALILHGLTPGPLMFEESPRIIYGIYCAVLMAGFMNLFCGWFGLPLFIRVLGTPRNLLYPVVMFTCMVGSYLADNSIFCTLVMLILAVLGFFMRKLGYSFVTFLIGFVLGPGFEMSLQQSLTISGNQLDIFYTRPIPIILFIGSLLMVYRIYKQWKKEKDSVSEDSEESIDLS